MLCMALVLLAQLLAVLCAAGTAALARKWPPLALLPPLGTGLAAALGLTAGAGGPVWFGAVLCGVFGCLGSLAGLAAGAARSVRERRGKGR